MASGGRPGTARGSRNGPKRSNASSRGGITKRKHVRADGDGDLNMDGGGGRFKKPAGKPSRPNARVSRGTSRNVQNFVNHLNKGKNGPKTRSQDANLEFLRVGGLKKSKAAAKEDGGLGDLLDFLERKASSFSKQDIAIKQSNRVGDYVYIGARKRDAEELFKLNGFTFAGTQLEVKWVEDDAEKGNLAAQSKDTQEIRAQLQNILSQRYIGVKRLLKLDALDQDPDLVTIGMFESRDRAIKTFRGLMGICDALFETDKEKQDAVESISLAGNNIDNVNQVDTVAKTFPHLKNLDMSNNQIASIESLKLWMGKFRHLETIVLAGNPIETADPNYRATLLEWFPKLQNINNDQLRTPAHIAELEAKSKPKPWPNHGPDFRDVGGIGETFLLAFFNNIDNNRAGLVSMFYDEDSQWSVSVDTHSVRDANAPPPMPWSAYIKISRNLVKITHQNARLQRLFRGANSIRDAWTTLPPSRHPNIQQELTKYIMDSHPLQGLGDPSGQSPAGVDGLFIAVHGEFDEQDPNTKVTGKRSFSRTFILGPGKTGSNSVRVISDMLCLRAYSPLPNVFAPPAPSPEDHQAMIAELSRQTNMTAEYSEMCLTQANWDFNNALVSFNEKRAQLPPEAFATMAGT
ncbi:mRNA export factor MEX67 [Fusarium albosuccineum]|uniref:mRNA export factor MEX67 n=1 Tax=Fusarium albosuccineum TaxID=1237068 RepID=A0A8H4PIB9_9HYPO|nr:mRNA export factor MEX67 [Fusarium albosuccineum]